MTDGVYRLSGQSSHIVTLKREFEGGKVPDTATTNTKTDVHAVASLLKVSKYHNMPQWFCFVEVVLLFGFIILPLCAFNCREL